MDRMQKTLIILLTLSQTYAFERAPDIAVGVGVEHQSNQLLAHFLTFIPNADRAIPKTVLERLTLEGSSSVLTFELSQRVNNQISAGVRAYFKSTAFPAAAPSLAIINESPQIEVLTKYHLHQATYGLGLGLKKDSYSISPNPLKPFSHFAGESITPSVSLSSTVQLPGAKLELHASLARAVFVGNEIENETNDSNDGLWQTTSRVSLLFNI